MEAIKETLEWCTYVRAYIVVKKKHHKLFQLFLNHHHIFESRHQKIYNLSRFNTSDNIFYYDIFSVDESFKYSNEIPKYANAVFAERIEGFSNFIKMNETKEKKEESKTIPVREVTWQDVINEKIPCYFWTMEFNKDSVYVGWLSEVFDEYYDETRYPLRFQGCGVSFNYTAPFQYCKPIDSAIIVVEPKKSEKKYRPFRTFNEAMKAMDVHGQWIVNKNKDYYLFVHCLNFQNEKQMNETFKGYQFLDGTPFGVLEEVK